MRTREYYKPQGFAGVGSDIKWCSRIKGRKKCALCFKYSELSVWTKQWNWFYLLKWYDCTWYYDEQAHYKIWKPKHKPHDLVPINYRSTGLKDFEIKTLIKKGCKDNKRCRCMSVIQRAFWYCPECYKVVNALAKMEGVHPHNIMITERNELKAQVLILRLSGSIQF